MKRLPGLALPVLLLFLAGCQELFVSGENERPSLERLSWVAKNYVGGTQCSTSDSYEPPSIEHFLEDEGVAVYETEVQHHPVCAACGCPAYAATHYALIKEAQLDQAEQLGFKQKVPPERK